MTSSAAGVGGGVGTSASAATGPAVELSGAGRAASGVVIPHPETSAKRAVNTANDRGQDSVMCSSWSGDDAA
jgi:cobalamin biosynthesis protein CbiD